MRTFSSLQKRKVETSGGHCLGRCHDLRGELKDGKLTITGLCVGREGLLAHFGLRNSHRHTVVPWEAVIRIERKRIVVRDDAHSG